MATPGFAGKILLVNLTNKEIQEIVKEIVIKTQLKT